MMRNIVYFVLVAMVFNPMFAFDARADRWSEAVTSNEKNAASNGDFEPSSSDAKQGAVKSPYKACEAVMLVEPKKVSKRGDTAPVAQSAYWDARKKACDESISNCGMKVQMLTAGASTMPFLERVRQRAVEKLDAGIVQYEKTKKTCFDSSSQEPSCKGAISSLRARLEKTLPEIRLNLAMLSTPTDKALEKLQSTGDYSDLINKELGTSLAGFVLAAKMDPLSNAEFRLVQSTYERLVAKARAEFSKENQELLRPLQVQGREVDLKVQTKKLAGSAAFTQKLKSAFAAHRADVMARYNQAIGNAPEAVYIGSASASPSVISAGLGKMIADQTTILSAMKSEINKGEKPDISYASYSVIANAIIEEDMVKTGSIEICATATQARNELSSRETRNGLLATAGVVGLAMVTGGVGGILGGAAAATTGAVTAGIVGGFAMTGMAASHALDVRRDARTGLTTFEDAQQVADGALFEVAASPLNFVGGVGVTAALAGAAYKGAAVSAKSALRRFGAVAVAKGAVKPAGTSSDEVMKLAATASALHSGEAAAKAGGEAVALVAAKEAASKLESVGEKGINELLKRTATATDEGAFRSLGFSGYLGSEKAPNIEVAQAYASVTQKMSDTAREKFAADLKKIGEVVSESRAAAVKAGKLDPVRDKEAGLLALEIAQQAPDVQTAAAVLKADSGYDANALRGVREVWKAAMALAKGAKETVAMKTKATVERVRTTLAKFTGKGKDSPEVSQLGCCMMGGSACAVKVGSVDPLEAPLKTIYYTCAAR